MQTRKKIAVWGITLLFLVSGSTILDVQAQKRKDRNFVNKAGLNEEQKENLKELCIEHAKATKDLKNELNELRARQKSLLSAEELDKKQAYANIDKMSAIKKQLRQEKLTMKLKRRDFLTEDQLAMFGTNRNQRSTVCVGTKGKRGRGAKMHSGYQRGQSCELGNAYSRNKRNATCRAGQLKRIDFLDLTDAQKDQMQELRLEHVKNTKSLRDEAEELRLKQRHVISSEEPDEALLMKNANRLSEIQNQLAKMRVDHQLEVRKILDKNQLTLFLSRPHMGKGYGRTGRGF